MSGSVAALAAPYEGSHRVDGVHICASSQEDVHYVYVATVCCTHKRSVAKLCVEGVTVKPAIRRQQAAQRVAVADSNAMLPLPRC